MQDEREPTGAVRRFRRRPVRDVDHGAACVRIPSGVVDWPARSGADRVRASGVHFRDGPGDGVRAIRADTLTRLHRRSDRRSRGKPDTRAVVIKPEPHPNPYPAARPGPALGADRREPQVPLDIGKQFSYDCPPGGLLYRVWGTGSYTSDSSICTAAVHRGLITVEGGGPVVIEIRPGQDSYRGTRRHGVTSRAWLQPWPRSFVFVE